MITDNQRNAIHKWLRLVAAELNAEGVTMQMLLEKKKLPVNPTYDLLKEVVWKPLCKAMYGVDSSEDLEPSQVNEIYIQADRFFNSLGARVDFPQHDPPMGERR